MAVTFRSSAQNAGSATSVAVSLPSGWQTGDFVVVALHVNKTGLTITQSAGSTFNVGFTATDASSHFTYAFAYRVMQAGDTAPTFSWGSSASFDYESAAFFSSVPLVLSLDAWSAVQSNSTAGNNVDTQAATATGTDGSVVLSVGTGSTTFAWSTFTWTAASGWTNEASTHSSSSPYRVVAVDFQAGVTGSVDPGAANITDSGNNKFYLTSVQLLILEGSSGATQVSDSDAGSGSEAQFPVVMSAEAGSGSDAGSVFISVLPVADSDQGAGSDAQGAVGLADVESATGNDGGVPMARVPTADAGTGGEGSQTGVAGADSGAGADLQHVTALVSSADAGTGSEFQFKGLIGATVIFSSDSGQGQEDDQEPAADTEAAAGADGGEQLTAAITGAEAAAGADMQVLVIAINAVYDTDGGSGGEDVVTPHADTDAASGADSQGPFPVSGADGGSGSEEAGGYNVGIWAQPPPWLYQSPGGGYLVVWRPGTAEEREVRRFERLDAHAVRFAEMIRLSGSLEMPSDHDGGTGADDSMPTATVRQYATGPLVTCGVPGAAEGARP